MPLNNFITIEKCDKRTARKISWGVIGFSILSFLTVTYSPFEYLFKYLGYKDSNGCPLLTFTGVPCPMCGVGRSLWSLIEPLPHNVFYYNPSALFLFIIAAILLLAIFILSLFKYRIKLGRTSFKLWYIPVLLLIVVWVVNIIFGHQKGS